MSPWEDHDDLPGWPLVAAGCLVLLVAIALLLWGVSHLLHPHTAL